MYEIWLESWRPSGLSAAALDTSTHNLWQVIRDNATSLDFGIFLIPAHPAYQHALTIASLLLTWFRPHDSLAAHPEQSLLWLERGKRVKEIKKCFCLKVQNTSVMSDENPWWGREQMQANKGFCEACGRLLPSIVCVAKLALSICHLEL